MTTTTRPYDCPTCGDAVRPQEGDHDVSIYCPNCYDVDFVGEEFVGIGLHASVVYAPRTDSEAACIEAWNEMVSDFIFDAHYKRIE